MALPFVVMSRKKYYQKLDDSLVSGYLSAVSALEGKKKVYLEPVSIQCEKATVCDCAFLGATSRGNYGLLINNGSSNAS